jgi:hypothetical protein
MKPTTLIGILSVVALSVATPSRGWTQWSVSLAVGSDRFWGGTLETGPERKSFRPYRPTVLGAGVEHFAGRIGLGLRIRYAQASLSLEGKEAVVAAKGAFKMIGIAPELSYQIATLGAQNRLLLHAGPVVEFWQPSDEDWRTQIGAHGAASLLIPLGERLGLSFEGSLAVVSSPFHADDLDNLYDIRPLWRRGFAAGMQYRL